MERQDEGVLRVENNMNKFVMAEKSTVPKQKEKNGM